MVFGAIVYAAQALAYRTRPVFVLTSGPTDPVARYRMAVMGKLRLFGLGGPRDDRPAGRAGGLRATGRGCSCSCTAAVSASPTRSSARTRLYAFDLPFYRLLLSFLFAALFPGVPGEPGDALHLRAASGWPPASARSVGRAHPADLLVGALVPCSAVALLVDRFELLSHTWRLLFTGAGYTDINAVLPAKPSSCWRSP